MPELILLFLSIGLSFLSLYTRKKEEISIKEKYVFMTILLCASVICYFSLEVNYWGFLGYWMAVPPITFFVDRLLRRLSLKFQQRDFYLYLRHSNEIDESFPMRGKNPHVSTLDIVFSMTMLVTIVGMVLLGALYMSPFSKKQPNLDLTTSQHLSGNSAPLAGLDSDLTILQRNYRDSTGWKQGVWDVYQKNRIIGFETYRNDTLHGISERTINYQGQVVRGSYTNGKKSGCWMHFENDSNLVMVVRYENDHGIWTGFPLADCNYPKPVKGFSIESDSVFIECPFANGIIWYKGLFIQKKPVGLHKMYYPSGQIKFEHDYSTGITREFDELSRRQ